MARTPRRRRITPLATHEPGNTQESEDIEETEEPSQSQDTGEPIPSVEPEEPVQLQEETMALEPVTDEEFDTYLDALDRLSMEQLMLVLNTAQHKRAEKQDEIRQQLIEEFRERARLMGTSLDAIFPLKSGTSRTGDKLPVTAKYRGPNGEGYSGRGVSPRWMTALLAEGHAKEDFLIGPDGTTEYERQRNTQTA
jgi:DNA-binding protein H-NS